MAQVIAPSIPQDTGHSFQSDAPTPIAQSLDEDPRYQDIRRELKQKWLQDHPGQDLLSGEGQNYALGHVGAADKPTLKSDADKSFQEKYPEDAKRYMAQDDKRIYDDYSQDPTVQAVDKEIQKQTGSVEFDKFNPTFTRVSGEAWEEFIRNFPEKAIAYAKQGHPEIQKALLDRGISYGEDAQNQNSKPQAPEPQNPQFTPPPMPTPVAPPQIEPVQKQEEPKPEPLSVQEKPKVEASQPAQEQVFKGQAVEPAGGQFHTEEEVKELETKLKTLLEENDNLNTQVGDLTKKVGDLSNLTKTILEQVAQKDEAKKKELAKTLIDMAKIHGITLIESQQEDQTKPQS